MWACFNKVRADYHLIVNVEFHGVNAHWDFPYVFRALPSVHRGEQYFQVGMMAGYEL